MMAFSRRGKYLIITLIVLGSMLPLIWYWAIFGGVPTIDSNSAIRILTSSSESAVLIDVRPIDLYQRQHIKGAQPWQLDQILALSSPDQIPDSLNGNTLLVICTAGFDSADAVQHLQNLGVKDIFSIRGGMQEYIAALKQVDPTIGDEFISVIGEPVFISMSLLEQLSAVIAGFVFKPTYMLLSLLLSIALWKARKPHLAALRYSILAFFIGEAWCAANYLLYNDTSFLSEYLHSFGMVVAFGFAIYAISDGMDTYMIKFSAQGKRCSAIELCRRCIKNEEVDCGIRKLLLLILPAILMLTFIPILASFISVSYNTLILGTPYNYKHLIIYQMFERRYCPAMALIMLILAFLILWRQPRRPISIYVRMLIAAGIGALGFSFFRLLFSDIFADNLIWSTFWEELTELIFLIAVCGVLLLFRHSLLTEVTGNWPWRLVK